MNQFIRVGLIVTCTDFHQDFIALLIFFSIERIFIILETIERKRQ